MKYPISIFLFIFMFFVCSCAGLGAVSYTHLTLPTNSRV